MKTATNTLKNNYRLIISQITEINGINTMKENHNLRSPEVWSKEETGMLRTGKENDMFMRTEGLILVNCL
jgi:hypothetical protein